VDIVPGIARITDWAHAWVQAPGAEIPDSCAHRCPPVRPSPAARRDLVGWFLPGRPVRAMPCGGPDARITLICALVPAWRAIACPCPRSRCSSRSPG
jgi:hypothetical protein